MKIRNHLIVAFVLFAGSITVSAYTIKGSTPVSYGKLKSDDVYEFILNYNKDEPRYLTIEPATKPNQEQYVRPDEIFDVYKSTFIWRVTNPEGEATLVSDWMAEDFYIIEFCEPRAELGYLYGFYKKLNRLYFLKVEFSEGEDKFTIFCHGVMNDQSGILDD